MALPVPVASFRTTITDKITSSVTTIPIDSTTDDDGNSMDGLVLFLTIDKGLSTEEYILGTVDATNSQLTSVTRGLSVTDGTTSVSGNKSAHAKKSFIEITSHAYLTRAIRMLNGTEETGGLMQNPASRTINSSRDIADKEYVDVVAATAGGISAFMPTDAGALTIDVASGYLVTGDGVVTYAGDTGVSMADDSTNYVELTLDGTLTSNTTGWTTGYVPIAIVTTASGDITVLTDARGWLTTPSGDVLVTNDATYGATIAANDLLYLDTATAKWKLADGSAEATADGQLGIALDAGSDTDTNKRVQIGGLVSGLSGLTAGWVYVSDTAGDLASSAGTYKRIVGYALNATTMFLISAQSADELTGGNASLTVANLNEAATFFANTDITGAEAETLTDGSDADTIHYHAHLGETTIHSISGFPTADIHQITTDQNGDNLYILVSVGNDPNFNIKIYRFSRDTATGVYYYTTDNVVLDGDVAGLEDGAGKGSGLCVGTTYVWLSVIDDAETDIKIYRYDLDLTNQTSITISGSALGAGVSKMAGDDNNLWLAAITASTTVATYSISGTTATRGSDITIGDGGNTVSGFYYDGTDLNYSIATAIKRYDTTGTLQGTSTQTIFDDHLGSAVEIGTVYGLGENFILGSNDFLYQFAIGALDGTNWDIVYCKTALKP